MNDESLIWLDPKRFLAWLYPPGHFIFYWWIAAGFFVATSMLDPSIQDNAGRKIGLVSIGIFAIFSGFWFLIGTYHVMFNDIKKLFIVYRLEVKNGMIEARGYYFKRYNFYMSDIAQLNSFKIKGSCTKRYSSFFSFADDNYQLMLNDGRCFYFQGAAKGIKEMLMGLSGINDVKNIGTFVDKISEQG